jgi:hypothetical protein
MVGIGTHADIREHRRITLQTVSQAIDEVFVSPADCMIFKLFLDNYEIGEIARFAGLSDETVRQILEHGAIRLERRLGSPIKKIKAACLG